MAGLLGDPEPPNTPQRAAEALARLGWCVLPIKPGGKHPPLPRWTEAASCDLDTVRNWFSGLYADHGVGVLTGPRSNVWVLDVDQHGRVNGYVSLQELEDAYGDLPHTVTARTGGGGRHIYFRWDPEHPVTNGDATRLPDGLDIRGEGGQVVAPPTSTGDGYEWLHDPWSTTVADAPGWLYALLEQPAEPAPAPATPPTPTATVTPTATDSPADWYRHHGPTWPQLLTGAGWTQLDRYSNDGDTYWVRPGKDARDGHSAVLHGTDGPLVVFSTDASLNALWAVASKTGDTASLSKYDWLTAQHGGDRRAAVATIRKQMPPATTATPSVPTVDISGDGAAAAEIEQDDSYPQAGFVDLAPWWDNPQPTKTADVLKRTDGDGLLYLDQLNWIHGDSGSGKTWILLAAMVQLVQEGRHVAWIHYEDPNPTTITQRLRMLGLTRTQVIEQFHYYDPQGEALNASHILEVAEPLGIEFIGLDSVGEAINAAAINEDSDHEVGPWIANGPRKIVNAGIGFCGVDHGTKNGTNEFHPSGSKRKRAAITGMGLLVKASTPPTKTTDGVMHVMCAKDRHGNYQQSQKIGIAHLRHGFIPAVKLTIEPPTAVDEDKVAHDKLVRDAVRAVEETPGITKTVATGQMSMASKARKLAAINDAIEQGLITSKPGPRGADELFPAPVDN